MTIQQRRTEFVLDS